MPRRLKIFLSAYACEPHKGSEPDVGWQWSLQLARFHDVTVLTRTNNRDAIETELSRLSGSRPLPRFVYHDLDPIWLALKRRLHLTRPYYILWQRTARNLVRQELQREHFDALHHLTFASFRYPTTVWGHGVPTIWGPVGGAESIPFNLLPWRYPGPLFNELVRNVSNFFEFATIGIMRHRAVTSSRVLASTRAMQRAFDELGVRSELMPTIGLNTAEIPARHVQLHQRPLRLLFVGNLQALKGVDLAVEALSASNTNARLTLVGDGPFRPALERLVDKLGMRERVEFRGYSPRSEVMALYPQFDALLFPSLHDTGGYAVIEAMLNQLPAICLQTGGPEAAVRPGTGFCVPLGSRRNVVGAIAGAIRSYDTRRELLVEHGRAAREVVVREYDWQRKGDRMAAMYEALFPKRQPRRLNVLLSAYACEPSKGSEPEVGWQWALKLSRFHNVSVITRANNKTNIQEGLRSLAAPKPQFLFYDLPRWMVDLKRKGLPIPIYYLFWQLAIRWGFRHKLRDFDVIHHVTFNSFREPGFWWFCPKPVVLGPLGGGQTCPLPFLARLGRKLPGELLRTLTVLFAPCYPHLMLSFFSARAILVANEDTARRISSLYQSKVRRLLETALDMDEQTNLPPDRGGAGNRLIWIGRLEKTKGLDLALHALAKARNANPKLILTVIGRGTEETALKALVDRVGLAAAVRWLGHIPRTEVDKALSTHDIFVFTSLRDTSGNVLLEAMGAGLPTIALRHQGAAEITTDETSIRISPTKFNATADALAQAILRLSTDPEMRARMSAAARRRLLEHFTWSRKAIIMDQIYQGLAADAGVSLKQSQLSPQTLPQESHQPNA